MNDAGSSHFTHFFAMCATTINSIRYTLNTLHMDISLMIKNIPQPTLIDIGASINLDLTGQSTIAEVRIWLILSVVEHISKVILHTHLCTCIGSCRLDTIVQNTVLESPFTKQELERVL